MNAHRPGGAVMGLVLAGGRSRRFGEDKALALLPSGETLLDAAVTRMRGWCAEVAVAGRSEAPAPCIPDHPRPGLGPLGGIAAGLRRAEGLGFGAVLVVAVDSLGLPDDLPCRLAPAPACLAAQPVVGLWPVAARALLEDLLAGDGSRSLRRFAELTGARRVPLERPPANANTRAELAAFLADNPDHF